MIGVALQIVNLDELHKGHESFLLRHRTMVAQATDRAGQAAEGYVQVNPGFKPRTGALQRATTHKLVRLSNGHLVRISNNAPYAAAIEAGARPHLIRAQPGKTLRFMVGGKVMFRKSVRHPGNRPYKFLYRATFSAYRLMAHDLERGMAALARKF